MRSYGGAILAEYNCTFGNASDYSNVNPGTGSIFDDAMFRDTSAKDFRLLYGSPCIDAGDPGLEYLDPNGSRNDMGALPYSNRFPTPFSLISPANSVSVGISTLRPLFSWNASVDPDSDDTVTYDFAIAANPGFDSAQQVLHLSATSYSPTTSLLWSKQYWWKVQAHDPNGGSIWSEQVFTFRTMIPGDANNDGAVDISDTVFLIAFIFSGGPAPTPLESGDANCDGNPDISDVVYLIAHIFLGGPAPCAVVG